MKRRPVQTPERMRLNFLPSPLLSQNNKHVRGVLYGKDSHTKLQATMETHLKGLVRQVRLASRVEGPRH